jgi:integrase
VFAHAVDKGRIARNPLKKFQRIYSADRSEIIWTKADITRFMKDATIELQRAMILVIHTRQSYGDLIRLRWSDYDGAALRLKQNMTSKRVTIPCTGAL